MAIKLFPLLFPTKYQSSLTIKLPVYPASAHYLATISHLPQPKLQEESTLSLGETTPIPTAMNPLHPFKCTHTLQDTEFNNTLGLSPFPWTPKQHFYLPSFQPHPIETMMKLASLLTTLFLQKRLQAHFR